MAPKFKVTALPDGQQTIEEVIDACEGLELLESEQVQRERYPLTTVEDNQERLQAIIAALAGGQPIAGIMRDYRAGWHTLQRIRAKYAAKIVDGKKQLANALEFFAVAGVEQMTENLLSNQMDPDKLPINVAVAIDKRLVLTGDPTAIIGHQQQGLTVDDLRARLQRRPELNVTPAGMGSGGDKDLQMREGHGVAEVIEADSAEVSD